MIIILLYVNDCSNYKVYNVHVTFVSVIWISAPVRGVDT